MIARPKSIGDAWRVMIQQKDKIAELELHLKQTLDNSISQSSALRDHIAELEAALNSLANGTWWDGNEPYSISRVESYVKAVLLAEVTQ